LPIATNNQSRELRQKLAATPSQKD